MGDDAYRTPSQDLSPADAKTVLLVRSEVERVIKPLAEGIANIQANMAEGQGRFNLHDYRLSALEKKKDDCNSPRRGGNDPSKANEPTTDRSSRRGMISEAVLLRIITIICALAATALGIKALV